MHRRSAIQPAPLSPVIEPHPIVIFAGGASHENALACHHAPNLTVSAKDIAGLRVHAGIARLHDLHYRAREGLWIVLCRAGRTTHVVTVK
jgi:hypothetical protein